MTIDGNNEVLIEAKLGSLKNQSPEDWTGIPLEVYLKVYNDDPVKECIHFANDETRNRISNGVFIGKVVFDESVKSSIPRSLSTRDMQKQNAPFVQRVRHNAVVRDGEKSYRVNGAKQ